MTAPVTPGEIHSRLTTDLDYFAQHAPLYIKDKGGSIIKFKMNVAQRYLHNMCEDMLRRKGYVRIVVIKARQLGISTYIAARFYHKAVRVFGRTVFVISHIASTTASLFDMVKRFFDFSQEHMRPEEGASNVHQKTFPGMQSGYTVATAGSKDSGRGTTAQLLHWSEVAFCPHAADIQIGVLNAIGEVPGSEIIKESTANGPIGLFYEEVMAAIAGRGKYELCFIPWFWLDEYETTPKEDFTLSAEDEAFIAQYLAAQYPRAQCLRKIAWMHGMIEEFAVISNDPKAGLIKFKQEYPANPIEAFQASGISLMRPEMIMEARKNQTLEDPDAPLILGVDSAGDGKNCDRTVLTLRRGRVLERIIKYGKMRDMELAGIIAAIIDKEHVDKCFIDVTYGHGTVDRLHELGYARIVQGVAFNERPTETEVYLNKRAEIIILAAQWVNSGGVRIPDDNELHADFACVPLDKGTSNGLRYIITKAEIKKLLGRSPDIYDAFALTFSYPVRRVDTAANAASRFRRAQPAGGGDAGAGIVGRKGPLSVMDRFRRK